MIFITKSNLILADTSSCSIPKGSPGLKAWIATSCRGTVKLIHLQGARAKGIKGINDYKM